MKLSERLALTPFLRIFVPLALGIIAASYVTVPLWAVVVITLGAYAVSWFIAGKPNSSAYIYASIFLSGICLAMAGMPESEVPQGRKIFVQAELLTDPYVKGRWQRSTARISAYREPGSDEWTAVTEKAELYVDTAATVSIGGKLMMNVYLNPIDTTGSSYGRLMRNRGIYSRIYCNPRDLLLEIDGKSNFVRRSQLWLSGRIERLKLRPDDKAMVKALSAGDKRGVDPALKDQYSKAGVAHIMAVSGLHLGFILILANMALAWIVLLPRGHIIKNIAVIILLWLYAAAVGFSPSVIRAAFMLSATQLALAGSFRTTGYNILFAAATIMLAVNPAYLFDISFQLSFTAVLSIMFFFPRLYRRRLSRNRVADFFLSSIVLSVAAQLGTMPIVAYNFGRLPMLATVINPLVIITSFIIISLAVLWVLAPLGLLNTVISSALRFLIGLQNGIVEKGAALPAASAENINLGLAGTFLSYTALLFLILLIKYLESRKTPKMDIFTE